MSIVKGILLNRVLIALAGAAGGMLVGQQPDLHSAFCTATQLPGLY